MAKQTKMVAWQTRISNAQDKFDENKSQIEKQLRFYDGDHWQGVATTYDQVTINYISTVVDILRDSVYFRNPSFNFYGSPVTAYVLNRVFPSFLKKINYKFHTKKCLFDALNVGFSYKLWGFHSAGLRTNDSIQENEVFGTWLPYDKVLVDPEADGLWNANYAFVKKAEPLWWVKENESLKVPKDLQASYWPESKELSVSQKTDLARVELMHIFDRGEGKHKIMIPGVDWFVYEDDWPLGNLNIFPVNMLRLNEDGLYCSGPTKKLLQMNEVVNKMESMKINHAKRLNRKYHVNGDLKEGEKALVSGIDGAIVKTDPEVEITPISDMAINPEVYGSSEASFFFMKLMARIGEYRSGIMPKGETTATEANYIEQGSSLAVTNLQDILGDFCETDSKIAIALMRENYDDERQVFDKDNNEYIVFDRNDLSESFDVSVDVKAAAPPNDIKEKQEVVQFFELANQHPYIDQAYLMKKITEAFPTLGDPNRMVNTQTTLQAIKEWLGTGGEENNVAIGAATGDNVVQLNKKYGGESGQ